MNKHSIIEMSLEDIMGDRFGKYSKYIIQDRALPDVRDGLKPVQRRILYAMYKEGNLSNKAFRKSAKTVGVVIGNYHPHGDTSVYDSMVRMSQDWKLLHPLIEIHGNNGSIDNDPAAAMRYTEARLSSLSETLLRDLEKETVLMALNFDDTELEPTVLPAKYPNLLVNGTTGISAGYATDIPPHNLGEVIDATIKRIDSPACRLDSIMEIMKGPDFPTGGIVQGRKGIEDAFKTGRGRIVVRSKVTAEKEKTKTNFIITEIPYEVNKAELVRKMDEIRLTKEIEGIIEVRDETDRTGLRIVIEVKNDIDTNSVLNYLYKNTDLQKNYNYNVVAINNRHPQQMGVLEILDAYINHQVEVIINRSQYELRKANERKHIVEGLIKAISILDEVLEIIRRSKDKQGAKNNLIQVFDFSDLQAEAIVVLRLYRLTSTDVTTLQQEDETLSIEIDRLKNLLHSDILVKNEIKRELKEVKKEYAKPRLTKIEDEITEIIINKEAMIPNEIVMVSITRDGYIKRMSMRSYASSEFITCGKKDNDAFISICEANTLDTLIVLMNNGHYLFIPVYELEEAKWKDVGKHISYLVSNVNGNDQVIGSILVKSFETNKAIVSVTQNGMIKQTYIRDLFVQRYSRSLKLMNLKKGDHMVSVAIASENDEVMITSKYGYNCRYELNDIAITGVKAAGVKAMNLKDDLIVSMVVISKDDSRGYLLIEAHGGMKRLRIDDIPFAARTTKGHPIYKRLKTPIETFTTALVDHSDVFYLYNENYQVIAAMPKLVNFSDLSAGFSYPEIVKSKPIIAAFFLPHQVIINQEEIKEKPFIQQVDEAIIPKQVEIDEEASLPIIEPVNNQEEKYRRLSFDDLFDDDMS